jgi:hypothetical protein
MAGDSALPIVKTHHRNGVNTDANSAEEYRIMLSTHTGQISVHTRRFIIAAAVAIALLFGSGLAVDARSASQIRPASPGENELVKAGHRYQINLRNGVLSGDQIEAAYPENHRIGQE